MQSDAIFPATWFVLSYLALLILIFAGAAYWARTHGQLDDTEAIKWKVFDDGIPEPSADFIPAPAKRGAQSARRGHGRDPQSDPADQPKRAAR